MARWDILPPPTLRLEVGAFFRREVKMLQPDDDAKRSALPCKLNRMGFGLQNLREAF